MHSTPSRFALSSTLGSQSNSNLNPTKQLQSTLSHPDHSPVLPKSSKLTAKDNDPSHKLELSARTTLSSKETPVDTVIQSTTMRSVLIRDNTKCDKRTGDLKSIARRHDHASTEVYNLLHLKALLPYGFGNLKRLQKSNINDEANAINTTISNIHPTCSLSAMPFIDRNTTKAEPFVELKTSPAAVNNPQLMHPAGSEHLPLLQNKVSSPPSSFILVESPLEPQSAGGFIYELQTQLCVSKVYHDYFLEHFHINYYGDFEDNDPFIASLRCVTHTEDSADICEARAIVRTQYRNYEISETIHKNDENNVLQILFDKAKFSSVQWIATIGDPKANTRIYSFDKVNDERYNCKIGVLCQSFNQINDHDIYSNNHIPTDMEQFLSRISKRVSLKGFQKYRGDLDTKDDLHGKYSYYTEYKEHEIMFNVAPLIPSTKPNEQCIERKSLVGNAFVCIIFQEPGARFSPDLIGGKVTQVCIVVQPIVVDYLLHYKIDIWHRSNIAEETNLPSGIFKYDASFRPFFLALLLKSTDVAVHSPSLFSRIYEQRRRLKHEELKKLFLTFQNNLLSDFILNTDYIHLSMDTHATEYRKGFSSGTTTVLGDSANTNTRRRSPELRKKTGFPRKILDAFAGRSGQTNSTTNNKQNVIPLAQSVLNESLPLDRPKIQSDGEYSQGSRSTKQSQELLASSSPTNVQNMNIQLPTSSTSYPMLKISDIVPDTNPKDASVLGVVPRSRSNSSPGGIINTNKNQSVQIEIQDYGDSTSTTTSTEHEKN